MNATSKICSELDQYKNLQAQKESLSLVPSNKNRNNKLFTENLPISIWILVILLELILVLYSL